MIQQTTALRKIAALKKPIRIIRGGQGAGKTISILILLCNHASSKPNKEILIISAELTKMRLTVIKDFVKVMELLGIYSSSNFIAGTLYRFPNGSFIKFIGLDKEDIGKGLRCDIVYFNEVNKIDFESYLPIASRATKVIADYNPDVEFFIDTEVITREDCDFITLTYKDNELLSEREREEILRYYTKGYNPDGTEKNAYWANLWRVYGLGNIGFLEGVIFTNWTIGEFQSIGTSVFGQDYGFSNDPTTLIETSIDKANKRIYIKQHLYKVGLTTTDIFNINSNIVGTKLIVGDSAEPRLIAELRSKGNNIVPIKKTEITFGIALLQDYDLIIDADSTDLIKELNNYSWMDKKASTPIDKHNHAIDSLRYAVTHQLINPNAGQYHIS